MVRILQPDHAFRSDDVVAFVVSTDDLFGTFSRKYDLPIGWGGLAIREDGSRLHVPDGAEVTRSGIDEFLLVRFSPFNIELVFDGLGAKDQYLCNAMCRLSIRISDDPGELVSFRDEVMGSSRQLGLEDLVGYIRQAAHQGMMAVAKQHTASDLVEGLSFEAMRDGLADAMKPLFFRAGLMLREIPVIRFDSSTLGEVRVAAEKAVADEARQAARRELEVAIENAREQHSRHLSDLLNELRTMADDSPDVGFVDLLKTFREQDRGELYTALLEADRVVEKSKSLVVAAGEGVSIFDATSPGDSVKQVPLDGPCGPVRSVRPGPGDSLLVGAARGVYSLSPDSSTSMYYVPDVDDPRGGFNSIAFGGGRIWGSHSELGLLAWEQGGDVPPVSVLASEMANARTVRGVCVAGAYVYCLIDNRIVRLHADLPADGNEQATWYVGADTAYTSLTVGEESLYAGTAHGEVYEWRLDTPDAPRVLHRGPQRAVESVVLLETGGITRLIFTDTTTAVVGRVLGDAFTCRYEAGGQTLRRAAATSGCIAAMNEMRDRFFIWSPGEPSRPIHTMLFTRQFRHSIQDICLW